MALWKQVLVTLVIAVAAVVGWGAFDPGARDRLAGLGVPGWALPQWAFLAEADAPDGEPATAAGERRGKGPGGGQGRGDGAAAQAGGNAGAGVQAGGAGGQGAGGPRSGGQGGGRGGFGGPITIVAAPASTARTNDRVTAIGTAEAARTVTVFPRSTGMVDEILFKSGETIASGAVLVRLDDDAERIALQRAEVTLADARAKAARYETLAGNKAISNVERDAALSELASAELAIREAQLALDRREIRAPFAGIVGLTAIETGEMVSATTEIVTIDDRSTLKVEFRIPEAFASKVALGQSIEAETPSRPGATFTGEVTAVGSRIEADSRTLVVQATVANTDDLLRPGMSFRVTLRFDGDDKTAVPALSLQWDRDGSYVWRVVGDKVERVPVTIVERNVETVLVEGGLSAGDTVVVEGVQRLRPGATVALATAPGESGADAPQAPPAAERRG